MIDMVKIFNFQLKKNNMSKWNLQENSSQTLKNIGEVPSTVMNKIIKFEVHLCHKCIDFRFPKARALATYFFLKTYTEEQDNRIESIYSILAALHLASKVFDVQRPIDAFIKGLELSKSDTTIISSFPFLRSINTNDPESFNNLKTQIIQAENDIIYKLNFQFNIPLPYDSASYVGNCLAHWHFPNPDIMSSFSDNITGIAYSFLNDLQAEHLFYKYPPDIIGLSSIYLACRLCNLQLADSGNNPWYRTLFPFRDLDEIKEAQQDLFNYFSKHGAMSEPYQLRDISMSPTKLKEQMNKFYIAPIEDYREIDELCPPPPLELLKEIAGPEDSFNHNWADHLPNTEPPPIDFFSATIPPPTDSLPRLKNYPIIETSEPEDTNSHPSTPSSNSSNIIDNSSVDKKHSKNSEMEPLKRSKTPNKDSAFDNRPPQQGSTQSNARSDHKDSTYIHVPPPPPPPPHPSRFRERSPPIRPPLYEDDRYRDRYDDRNLPPRYDDRPPFERPYERRMGDRFDDRPFGDPYYDRPIRDPYYDRLLRDPYYDRPPRDRYDDRPIRDRYDDHYDPRYERDEYNRGPPRSMDGSGRSRGDWEHDYPPRSIGSRDERSRRP